MRPRVTGGHAVTVTPVTQPALTSRYASDRGVTVVRSLPFPHSLYVTASLWTGGVSEIAVEQDGGHHRNQAGQSSAEVRHGLRVRELKLR
jgi:hypothetical protein